MSDDFTGVIESMAAEATDAAGSPPAPDESSPAEASASPAEPSASATTPAPTPLATDTQTIPYVRFREVNEERTRYKDSLDKLRWAEAIPEKAAPAIAQFYQDLQQDPIGTLLREVEGMMGDPAHSTAVRSAAARWMGSAQPARNDMPEADLQSADGTLVYSAAQAHKLMEWRDARTQEQFSKQMQPLQHWAAQQQAQTIRTEIASQAKDWAAKTYQQWSSRPHFTEHKAEIADLMERHAGTDYGIADAYAEMLSTTVFPTLQHTATSGVVAALHQKAAAGTTNPSRGPAQTAGRPTSFGEAMATLVREAGA